MQKLRGVFPLLGLALAILFWTELSTHKKLVNEAEAVHKLSTYTVMTAKGTSMEPLAHTGDKFTVKLGSDVSIGDYIVAEIDRCETVKCEQHKKTTVAKRLLKVDGPCYFIAGENQPSSWDSYDYGWLCDTNIKIIGKITQINAKDFENFSNITISK